jgi:hypothetical protein
MKPQNELALIVAYYLSRMDKEGYISLGYKSFREATEHIGAVLDVNPNTVKNMRDEFDPYNQNDRIGWQRELRGSRLKILESFQNTDDNTLFEIVKEILLNREFRKSEEYKDIHALFGGNEIRRKTESVYILRGPTGRAAEEFFIEHFKINQRPVAGKLIDSRSLGCGYDFEIQNTAGSYFIEIKGLAPDSGGILFTDKEWEVARKHGGRYYVGIVRNLSATPQITILQDPTSRLKAHKHIYSTVQVSWTVTKGELGRVSP